MGKAFSDFEEIPSLEELNQLSKESLIGQLGIEYTEVTKGKVVGRMPVDQRTRQPIGILHGGASIALAETVAGLGSMCLVNLKEQEIRGLNIVASHVGGISEGYVIAEANIIHQGRTTHIWNVDVKDLNKRLISTIRVTNIILTKK